MIIANRFTLRAPGSWTVEGAEAWIAHDARLDAPVVLLVSTDRDPDDVAASLTRVRAIRDPRLARLVAVGVADVPVADDGDDEQEDAGDRTERRAFAAVALPADLTVADVLGSRVLPLPLARLLVQRIADALDAAASAGLAHGALHPAQIGVTGRGRVVLAGAGLLRAFASSAPDPDDTAASDAENLAAIVTRAATALDVPLDEEYADVLEELPFPEELTGRERRLVLAALRGRFPRTVAGVVDVLGSTVGATLSGLRTQLVRLPRTLEFAPEPEPVLEEAEEALVAPAEGEDLDQWELERLLEEREISEIPTIAEAFFDLLHRRFPRSARVTAALERAHARALGGPRVNGARWTVLALLALVSVLVVVAVGMFRAPFSPGYDLNNPPPQSYPAFTFSPEPSPSPSPS